MTDTLKLIANSIMPIAHVKVSHLVDSRETVRWIPVLLCWSPDKNMGISEDGYWVIEETNGLRVLGGPQSYLRIEILLEQPLSKIREEITAFLDSFNVTVDVFDIFPFVEVIRAVVEGSSTYWAELAFGWYDELPIEKKKMLKDSLLKIVERKALTQKLRQKAIKEIKKWNK